MRSKDSYNRLAMTRRLALKEIADRLGADHQITKLMGSAAWGRHRAEQGPESTLRSAIREAAFLEGMFDVLNRWARDNDRSAQRIMLDIWREA